MKTGILVALLVLFVFCSHVRAEEEPLHLLGPVGEVPNLLAPGFINTGLSTRDLTMTSDGREIYFCTNTSGYAHAFILVTRLEEGAWTDPEVVSFSGHPGVADLEPALSPDDQNLFFYSTRPAVPGGEAAQDLWVVHRQGNTWGDPENLGAPVNTGAAEFFPSVTVDGTLYFCRADPETRRHSILRSRFINGKYVEPEKLPAEVNCGTSQFNAWISADEARLIVSVAGHPENRGRVDYWLCRRNADDTWHDPVNLGPVVNDGSGQSWSPSLSPDGRYFFFMSSRTVGEPMSWPVSWSELQWRHGNPGCGRPGIFVMGAEFLGDPDSLSPKVGAAKNLQGAADSSPESTVFETVAGRFWGQDLPGTEPEIFAPGVLSTGLQERDIALSTDGGRLMYGVLDLGIVTIMVSDWQGDRWSEPHSAPWHRDKDSACLEPALSADGQTVFFLSNQAAPGQTPGRGWANQNIFTSRHENGSWSEAVALPAPVTTDAAEYFPSLASDGTLFFTRENGAGHSEIWAACPGDDGFDEPVLQPSEVNVGTDNYNAFIAPDQSFIILCVAGHENNIGRADYWISFRGVDGAWLSAQNMGPVFNREGSRATSAFLSPDGAVLFFSSDRQLESPVSVKGKLTREDLLVMHAAPGMGSSDLWWVDASVLDGLKSEAAGSVR